MNHTRRAPSRSVPLPWILWSAILATALLAAYVHLLTSAVDRGETLRRHPAAAGPARASADPTSAPEPGLAPPIPPSHVALIVVP